MNQLLDHEIQHCIMSGVTHAAEMSKVSIQEAATAYTRPSVMYRPALSIDGNQWCALYGANLQEGVAGFGNSPADAMWAFDQAWVKPLPTSEARG